MIDTEITDILEKVRVMKQKRARLVQICCTKIEQGFELTYSFDNNDGLENIRVLLPEGQEIQSISSVFEPAFLYENEIKDLYGVPIQNISLDFEGNFYKLTTPAPFAMGDA